MSRCVGRSETLDRLLEMCASAADAASLLQMKGRRDATCGNEDKMDRMIERCWISCREETADGWADDGDDDSKQGNVLCVACKRAP